MLSPYQFSPFSGSQLSPYQTGSRELYAAKPDESLLKRFRQSLDHLADWTRDSTLFPSDALTVFKNDRDLMSGMMNQLGTMLPARGVYIISNSVGSIAVICIHL